METLIHTKHNKSAGGLFLALIVTIMFALFGMIMYVFSTHTESAKSALSMMRKIEVDFQMDLFDLIQNEAKLDATETKAEFAYFKSFIDKYVNTDSKKFNWYNINKNGDYMMETVDGSDVIYSVDTELLVPTNGNTGDGLFNIVSKKDPSKIIVRNVYPQFGPAVYDFLNLIVSAKRIGGPKGDPIVMRNRGFNKMVHDTGADCTMVPEVSMNGKWMTSMNNNHPNNMNGPASDYIYRKILSEKKYEGPFFYFFTEPRVDIASLKTITIGSAEWFRKYPMFNQPDRQGIEVGWTFVLDQPFVDIEKGLQLRITYAGQSYEFIRYFDNTFYDYMLLKEQLEKIVVNSSIKNPLLILPFMVVLIPLFVMTVMWFRFVFNNKTYKCKDTKQGGDTDEFERSDHKTSTSDY